MLVLKFGRTSVAAAEPIVRAAAIVGGAQGRRVVVVSALAGVTDRLLQTAGFAVNGKVDAMQRIYEQLVAQPPTRMDDQTTAAAGRDVRLAFAAAGAQPS